MKSDPQRRFESALESFIDGIASCPVELREAAQAVIDDHTKIGNPNIGGWIMRLEGRTTPYLDLTYASSAKRALKVLLS